MSVSSKANIQSRQSRMISNINLMFPHICTHVHLYSHIHMEKWGKWEIAKSGFHGLGVPRRPGVEIPIVREAARGQKSVQGRNLIGGINPETKGRKKAKF